MPVLSNRAKLPLLCSALLGLCMLGAEGYVLTGLIRRHAEGSQILFASVSLVVFAVWLRGYVRSVSFLSRYAREEAALPKAKTALEAFAREVEAGNWNRQSLAADTPLLERRLIQAERALHRGAPLLSGGRSRSETQDFPGPEREIQTWKNIALSIGIAGTFVSLLITLGQPQGLGADTALAYIGSGTIGGLASVIAALSLQLCYRALQDEQDFLADEAEQALDEGFVATLPTAVTSPEERVVTATRELAMHATSTLEKQTAATQVTLAQQAEQYDTLLKAFARQITTMLLQQVQQPMQQIADHTQALAQHSGTWAASVSDLKAAHLSILNAHKEGQAQHEQRLATTFAQYHKALDLSLQVVKQANDGALQQTQEFTKRLAALQMQELKDMTAQWQRQFAAVQTEQEAVHQRLTEAAITAMGGAVETRIATLDGRVAATLATLESRLPNTLRDGVQAGLSETILLIEAVREQTAGMAHTLGQISGNADRQLQAYERWNERAMNVQGRLEQVVTDGQAAQAAQLAQWQHEAAQTLEGVRTAFDSTIYTAQSGFTRLVGALDPLTTELQRLQATAQDLQRALSALPSHTPETPPTLDGISAADPDVPAVPELSIPPASALPEWARPAAVQSQRDMQG